MEAQPYTSSFPTHTFPSSISPYRPPQALKSTRIVKIVVSDEAPPAWTTNTLSMLTSGSSTPVPAQSSGSGSQLSRMMSAMSTNETSFGTSSGGGANMHQVHFACVSEGGEVFVFGVPGAPPVGTLGGASDGAELTTSSGTRLETLVASKLFKPQRVWGLKRGLVGAVRASFFGFGSLFDVDVLYRISFIGRSDRRRRLSHRLYRLWTRLRALEVQRSDGV